MWVVLLFLLIIFSYVLLCVFVLMLLSVVLISLFVCSFVVQLKLRMKCSCCVVVGVQFDCGVFLSGCVWNLSLLVIVWISSYLFLVNVCDVLSVVVLCVLCIFMLVNGFVSRQCCLISQWNSVLSIDSVYVVECVDSVFENGCQLGVLCGCMGLIQCLCGVGCWMNV